MTTGRLSWFYLAILLIALIHGCDNPETPQEVAQNFWNAIKVQDIDTARKYSTVATRDSIELSEELFHDAIVTFGKIIIDGSKTTIETTLQTSKNSSEAIVPLLTILKKEEGVWRVDYEETKNTIKDDISLSEMVNDLRKLGEELSNNVNETLSKLKQKIPEIEKKVQNHIKITSKEIEESFQQHIPEIKKSIEELGKTLEGEAQDAWQQHVPKIKKGIEEFGQALEEALKNGNNNTQQDEHKSQSPNPK